MTTTNPTERSTAAGIRATTWAPIALEATGTAAVEALALLVRGHFTPLQVAAVRLQFLRVHAAVPVAATVAVAVEDAS